MCVINEVGKSPIPMSSKEQVAQDVENGAEIIIAKVENDETSNVDNEIQFEISSVEVQLTKLTYKFEIVISLTKKVLNLATYR